VPPAAYSADEMTAAMNDMFNMMAQKEGNPGTVARQPTAAEKDAFKAAIRAYGAGNQKAAYLKYSQEEALKIFAENCRVKQARDKVKEEIQKGTAIFDVIDIVEQIGRRGQQPQTKPKARPDRNNGGRVAGLDDEEDAQEEQQEEVDALKTNKKASNRGGRRGRGGNNNSGGAAAPRPQHAGNGSYGSAGSNAQYNRGGRADGRQAPNGQQLCHFCEKPGHWIRHCPEKREVLKLRSQVAATGAHKETTSKEIGATEQCAIGLGNLNF
jgi:hypothetical protein